MRNINLYYDNVSVFKHILIYSVYKISVSGKFCYFLSHKKSIFSMTLQLSIMFLVLDVQE